ncbi:hypothetical protein, partial [Brevibacterium casei]|uniref:hypothetical protein n=1 Tax=Brevibacterium casei TaxID=33889 RepID=UPI001D04FE84
MLKSMSVVMLVVTSGANLDRSAHAVSVSRGWRLTHPGASAVSTVPVPTVSGVSVVGVSTGTDV